MLQYHFWIVIKNFFDSGKLVGLASANKVGGPLPRHLLKSVMHTKKIPKKAKQTWKIEKSGSYCKIVMNEFT